MKRYWRKSGVVVLLVLLLLALSVSAAAASGGGGTYHTVQTGETLFSIGRLYGVNPYSIAAVNHLANPNCIYAGQVLYVPSYDQYYPGNDCGYGCGGQGQWYGDGQGQWYGGGQGQWYGRGYGQQGYGGGCGYGNCCSYGYCGGYYQQPGYGYGPRTWQNDGPAAYDDGQGNYPQE